MPVGYELCSSQNLSSRNETDEQPKDDVEMEVLSKERRESETRHRFRRGQKPRSCSIAPLPKRPPNSVRRESLNLKAFKVQSSLREDSPLEDPSGLEVER